MSNPKPHIESIEYFRFFYGGYFDGNHIVLYSDNRFSARYDIMPFPQDMLFDCIVPKTMYKRLIRHLNDIDVLKWRSSRSKTILDGMQGSVVIGYDCSKKKKLYYSNSFPDSFFELKSFMIKNFKANMK